MVRETQLWRLFFQLLLYYLITVGGLIALIFYYPESREFLPVGGIDELPDVWFAEGETIQSSNPYRAINLTTALIGTLMFIFPVSSCYLATRESGEMQGRIVETIFLLPIIVATVIIVVQHSMALAFSLAGIVAAVRFRHTLKSPADAVFVFAAIAIGLCAGVNEIGVAGVASMVFCLTVLGLKAWGYGIASPSRRA